MNLTESYTYKVPGMIWLERSKISAGHLRKLYGDKIEHNIVDISENVKAIRGKSYNQMLCIKKK